MDHDTNSETIIRQHRRWTKWIEDNRIMGEGSLILTNHRLLFLNRIEASPEVSASIKELADAPMEKVLDHALTLHKSCFQIPLTSIMRVEIISLFGFPFPRFRLSIIFLKGKKLTPHTAEFVFKTYGRGMPSQPQIITDWGWKSALKKAINNLDR